jgi:XrtJ-associated TM-motif-TM protein
LLHREPPAQQTESEVIVNLKKALLAAFALTLAVALPLRAQSGCTDSPEDPTLVLALVSGAGALAGWAWKKFRLPGAR